MSDLKSPTAIIIKGFLFLFLGFFSAGLLLVRSPELATGVLLAITIWAFCRFYYFAFYVLQQYVDPNYRFAGLTSFFQYFLSGKRQPPEP